jgi:hypothetical protein
MAPWRSRQVLLMSCTVSFTQGHYWLDPVGN